MLVAFTYAKCTLIVEFEVLLMSCNWIYFPNTKRPPRELIDVVGAFDSKLDMICSTNHMLKSNEVLDIVSSELRKIGFAVESGKKKDDLLEMPVLFSDQGNIEKTFYADAFHNESGIVLEVEAGRATANNQFLKDFFEACMMQDAEYLCIAVRMIYGPANSPDYEKVKAFFRTLYASDRLSVPLRGIMIIGY